MNFLAPLFLLGALAVAAPILLHLIRRTTRERIPFSSLIFLKPTPPRVTRRSRLENIFLLILRCLVLAFLAAGFSRPFLNRPVASPPPEENGTQWVVLVDASASMQRAGLWNKTLNQAERWFRQSGPLDQVSLIVFGGSVRTVLSFEEWQSMPLSERAAAASERLRALRPGWSNTPLGPAILDALEALTAEPGDDGRQGSKEIIVISDLQEGARLDGLQGMQWPPDVKVRLDLVSTELPTNAGLVLLPEATSSGSTRTTNAVRVMILNAEESKREQFQLRWRDGQDRPLDEAPANAYVPPGQRRTLTVSWPAATNDMTALLLEGDDHAFDNRSYYAPARQLTQTLILAGAEFGPAPEGLRYYLERAFQETRQRKTQFVEAPEDRPMLPGEWETARLLVATGPLRDSTLNLLRVFLQSGRHALLVLREPADANLLFDLLNVPRRPVQEAVVPQYAMFGDIDFAHPWFQPFADPRYSDFTKIHFWHYRQLDLEGLPEPTVVARFDRGDPAFLEWSVGRGVLHVMTTSWRPADSQLALSSKFVPLLHFLLALSGETFSEQVLYFVGDPIPLPGTGSDQTVSITDPSGAVTNMPAGVPFLGATVPGIYAVGWQGRTNLLAVNVPAEESRTTPLASDELERLGLPLTSTVPMNPERAAAELKHLQSTELENRQKLWRYLLVAALLMLLTETWVAGRLSRAPTS